MRDGHPAVAGRGGTRGHWRGSGLRRPGWFRGPGRLGEPEVSRDVPRLPAGSELRLSRWRRARRVSFLRGAGFAEAQRLGALGRLDRREGGQRTEPSRWADRVSLPRPRRQSGLATADARGVGAVPRPRRRSSSRSRPRARRRRRGPRNARSSRGSTSLSASKERSPTAPFEIAFLAPGVEAYVFTFG